MECQPGESRALAVVVSFNPDVDLLSRCLDALAGQVERIILVDNDSVNRDEVLRMADECATLVECVALDQNRGISVALNRGVARARELGAHFVLLLDQDSVVAPNAVLSLAESVFGHVAMVAPLVADRNRPDLTSDATERVQDVNFCITSGSLLSTEAWSRVGGYDEAMFIDFVDFDFCLRLRVAGYRIVRDYRVQLAHAIGDQQRRGILVAYNHSPFRLYHMSRDMLYYASKHKNSPGSLRVNGRSTAGTLLVLLKKIAVIGVLERSKLEKMSAIIRGAWTGLKSPARRSTDGAAAF